MIYVPRAAEADCLGWFRDAARRMLAAGVEPDAIAWGEHDEPNLFADPLPAVDQNAQPIQPLVPASFLATAETVACHRDPARWSLLYQALWRITHGENRLPDVMSDPLMHRLGRMAVAVKHDQHRMTAFVRFRVKSDDRGERFIAWYQPEHLILRRTAGFFVDRFAALRFSILTPDLSLHWDGDGPTFCAGHQRQDALWEDAVEAWWQQYYSATFNPARANPRLTARHMPKRFRRDLPEAATIQDLLSTAAPRADRMVGTAPRKVS